MNDEQLEEFISRTEDSIIEVLAVDGGSWISWEDWQQFSVPHPLLKRSHKRPHAIKYDNGDIVNCSC